MAEIWSRVPVFSLILIRVGALLFSMPMIGARSIPIPVKVGLAVALTWGILPLMPPAIDGLALSPLRWWSAALREALIGLSIGWLARICVAAVPLAGQTIGYQMGFGIANVIDPLGQQQLSVIAQFLNLMALWVFLAIDGHHLVITALFESFRWVPPAGGWFRGGLGEVGLEAGHQLFRSALLLAAPVMLVLIFVKVGLGIVARTVPQMNVFIVALPLQIGVGLLTVGAALGFLAPWLARNIKWLDGIYFFLGKGS